MKNENKKLIKSTQQINSTNLLNNQLNKSTYIKSIIINKSINLNIHTNTNFNCELLNNLINNNNILNINIIHNNYICEVCSNSKNCQSLINFIKQQYFKHQQKSSSSINKHQTYQYSQHSFDNHTSTLKLSNNITITNKTKSKSKNNKLINKINKSTNIPTLKFNI